MKKLLLSLSILLLASISVFAQHNEYRLSPDQEEKCTEITRAMVKELRLNEIGYIKLKALNRERMALTASVKESLKHDQQALEQQLQKIETDFDQKLTALLDANQLQAYAIYKGKSENNFIAVSEEK